jgi:purine nucleoside permease
LLLSPHFNLTNTYFLIAGIAGVNPRMGTINDVTFSRFTVQVALQYEFDAREIPGNFSTGYVPQGAQAPNQYPKTLYGTEVFEVNDNLRQYVYNITKNIKPKDTPIAANYRQNYKAPEPNIYKEAARSPKILKCDIACSDVYFSGTLLSEAFDNTTRLLTNGSGIPCMTAQEDNATLEPMIRFAQHKLIDFSRIIILRSAADFDRPYPGLSNIANLFYVNQGSFISSIENLYIVGMPVVKTILNQWKTVFEKGIKPTNYIGDIFGTLGGMPDFGPGEGFVQSNPVSAYEPVDLPTKKRDEESERSFEELYGGMTRADFYRKKRAFVG